VELPRLEPLWQKYHNRGFSIIAVEANQDTERATKFIDENHLTFHFLETEENNDVVADVYDVHWFPTSYMIDGAGRVMYCHVGFEEGDEADLNREILDLFAESDRASR
jgi:peroxiredoxin